MHTKLPVPEWFTCAMAAGIAGLLPLRLRNSPAHDAADLTAEEWAAKLWPQQAWSITVDEERIAEAFRLLGAGRKFWPAPIEMVECLPRRAEPPTWKRRQEKPMSPEARAEVREMIREMAERLDHAEQLEREAAEAKIAESKRRADAFLAAHTQPPSEISGRSIEDGAAS